MKPFNEDQIKRTGLPQDVMGLIHDLCYHVNNNLRGTMDKRAIENYCGRAQEILKIANCEECKGTEGRHVINCSIMATIMYQRELTCDECHGEQGTHAMSCSKMWDR